MSLFFHERKSFPKKPMPSGHEGSTQIDFHESIEFFTSQVAQELLGLYNEGDILERIG